MNGMIRVLWSCDMGDGCINKERPGVHDEHREMEQCRGLHTEALQPEPTPIPLKRIRDPK
jgi:hypothetical protein